MLVSQFRFIFELTRTFDGIYSALSDLFQTSTSYGLSPVKFPLN
jgi:hypothetical protein